MTIDYKLRQVKPANIQGSCEICCGEYDNGQIDITNYGKRLNSAFADKIDNI